MAYNVTIKESLSDQTVVVLPNGLAYEPGESAILSISEYQRLSDDALADYVDVVEVSDDSSGG